MRSGIRGTLLAIFGLYLSVSAASGIDVLYTLEDDNAEGPATDQLRRDGGQDAPLPVSPGVLPEFDAEAPIDGTQSLAVPAPSLFRLPHTRDLGTQVTLAAHIRDQVGGDDTGARLLASFDDTCVDHGGCPAEYFEGLRLDVNPRFTDDMGYVTFRYKDILVEHAAGVPYDDGNAHHIAATWNDGIVTLYFDGNDIGSGGAGGAGSLTSARGDLLCGGNYAIGREYDHPLTGGIDNLMVLHQVLSPAQIADLAINGQNASFLSGYPDAPGDILYTMEGDTGTVLTDKLDGNSIEDADFFENPVVIDAATEVPFGTQVLRFNGQRRTPDDIPVITVPGTEALGSATTLAAHVQFTKNNTRNARIFSTLGSGADVNVRLDLTPRWNDDNGYIIAFLGSATATVPTFPIEIVSDDPIMGSESLDVKNAGGGTNYVEVPDTANLGSQVTLSMKIRDLATETDNSYLFSTVDEDDGNRGLIVDITPNWPGNNMNNVLFRYNPDGNNRVLEFLGPPLDTVGNPHTVTVSWDDGFVRTYVDGAELTLDNGTNPVASGDLVVSTANIPNLRLFQGRFDFGGGPRFWFDGAADDVLVMKQVLTPQQVQDLHTQGAETFLSGHTPAAGEVLYTMEGDSGQTVTDKLGGDQDATLPDGEQVPRLPFEIVLPPFDDDALHHVAVTYDDGVTNVYWDGGEVLSAGQSGDVALDMGTPLVVGQDVGVGPAFDFGFDGLMDNILVLKEVLGPTDVADLAANGASAAFLGSHVAAPGEVLYTMEGDSGDTVTDQLGGDQDTTLPAANIETIQVLVSTDNPIIGTHSLQVDNNGGFGPNFLEVPESANLGSSVTLSTSFRDVADETTSSYLFSTLDPPDDNKGLTVEITPNRTTDNMLSLIFRRKTDLVNGSLGFLAPAIDTSIPHTATVTWDDGTVKAYMDGTLLDPVVTGAVLYDEGFETGPQGWHAFGSPGIEWQSTGGADGTSGWLKSSRESTFPAQHRIDASATGIGPLLGDLESNFGSNIITFSFFAKMISPAEETTVSVSIETGGGNAWWEKTDLPGLGTDWQLVTYTIDTNWTDQEAADNGWVQKWCCGGSATSWSATLDDVVSMGFLGFPGGLPASQLIATGLDEVKAESGGGGGDVGTGDLIVATANVPNLRLFMGRSDVNRSFFDGVADDTLVLGRALNDEEVMLLATEGAEAIIGILIGRSPPDIDRDGDVDGFDLQIMEDCISGPAVPAAPGCGKADLDADFDVDQGDFAVWQRCISGDGIPYDPACTGF